MKPFACTPADGEADHGVAGLDRAPSTSSSRSTTPTQVPAKSSSPVAVDAGQLGGLAADERDARRAAHLGRALDELGDLLELDLGRGDVVEQQQRRRARS